MRAVWLRIKRIFYTVVGRFAFPRDLLVQPKMIYILFPFPTLTLLPESLYPSENTITKGKCTISDNTLRKGCRWNLAECTSRAFARGGFVLYARTCARTHARWDTTSYKLSTPSEHLYNMLYFLFPDAPTYPTHTLVRARAIFISREDRASPAFVFICLLSAVQLYSGKIINA